MAFKLRSITLYFVLFVLVLLGLNACAHQPGPTTADTPASRSKKSPAHSKSMARTNAPADLTISASQLPQGSTGRPGETIVEEKGNVYRILKTPFGPVKQLIGPAAPAAASPSPDATPVAGRPPEKAAPKSAAGPAESKTGPQSTLAGSATVDDQPSAPGGLTLNFDDADLYEVIRTFAEILGINYITDPTVRGQVTIHTAGSLSREDLFPIFYQILEANGLTAVKEGPVYKIIPLKDAPRQSLPSRYGRDQKDLPPSERIIMQLIPLKYISAEEMIKILTPFISVQGTIVSHNDSNTLLLVDKGETVLKVLRLVEAFDIDIFATMKHRFFKVEYNDVKEIGDLLKDVLAVYQGKQKEDFKVIPIKHLNTLLVFSKNTSVFDEVDQLMKTLDAPNAAVQPRLYVYSVKNGQAGELAELLNSIFSSVAVEKKESKPSEAAPSEGKSKTISEQNPFMMKPEPVKAAPQAVPVAVGGEGLGSGTLRGEIRITPDEIRNALVIEAIPSDYQVILNILDHLDILPRQVLIEAVIAEIELSDDTSLGVDWEYVAGKGGPSTSVLSAAMGGTVGGLKYTVGQTDRWSATLSALAKDNKADILSAPSLLASNDKEARIDISDEIPIASSEYQYGSSGDLPVVATKIEYRNTGLILSVTPHINQNGLVSLELNHELSENADAVKVADKEYPSFKKRSVKTNLTVGHNQTIAIGGLISEKKTMVETGVPGLKDIPLLGFLFGSTTEKKTKKELIILITPRVIVDLDDVDEVTQEFRAKVKSITY